MSHTLQPAVGDLEHLQRDARCSSLRRRATPTPRECVPESERADRLLRMRLKGDRHLFELWLRACGVEPLQDGVVVGQTPLEDQVRVTDLPRELMYELVVPTLGVFEDVDLHLEA